jgi:hypothetical protein
MMIRASEPPMKYLRFAGHLLIVQPSFSSPNLGLQLLRNALRSSAYFMINEISFDMRTVNPPFSPVTSDQIRAARALLRWRAEDLARASGVGVATIRRAELAAGHTSMTLPNDMAVRRALEAGGVEFIDENGGGPGVRWRKRQQKKG